MTTSEIPGSAACRLYKPGHAIGVLHWMATRGSPRLMIRVVHVDETMFLVDVNGRPLWYQTHDLRRVQKLVQTHGPWAEFRGKGVVAFDGKLVNVREYDRSPLGPCETEPRDEWTTDDGAQVTPYVFADSSIDLGSGRLNR